MTTLKAFFTSSLIALFCIDMKASSPSREVRISQLKRELARLESITELPVVPGGPIQSRSRENSQGIAQEEHAISIISPATPSSIRRRTPSPSFVPPVSSAPQAQIMEGVEDQTPAVLPPVAQNVQVPEQRPLTLGTCLGGTAIVTLGLGVLGGVIYACTKCPSNNDQ